MSKLGSIGPDFPPTRPYRLRWWEAAIMALGYAALAVAGYFVAGWIAK